MLFDKPTTLNIDAVLGWNSLILSSLQRVRQEALRLTKAGDPLPEDMPSELNYASPEEIFAYFDSVREEVDLSTAFVIIASAEARLRLDAKSRAKYTNNPLSTHLNKLYQKVDQDWKVPFKDDGILDAWKYYLNFHSQLPDTDKRQAVSLLGDLKSTLAIRHWIAHGRYWDLNLSIKSFLPATVARSMKRLYRQLQDITDHDGLVAFNPMIRDNISPSAVYHKVSGRYRSD